MTPSHSITGETGGKGQKLTPYLVTVNSGSSVPESGTNGFSGHRQGRCKLNCFQKQGLHLGAWSRSQWLLRTHRPTLLSHRPQPTLSGNFFIIMPCWVLGAIYTLKPTFFMWQPLVTDKPGV